ncbi:hypothetical protein EQ832_01510 [Pseudomonas sp. ALS1131]|nr:hypothetical protein [Pseudomonas sp. ALS1131]TRO41719.1 hypothetical protein EQ832_01510 [Pseudomonas sp. ALS1131]
MASTITLTINDHAVTTQLAVNDTAHTVVLTVTDAKGDPGKSAYQVWLEQGNTGSESDFFQAIGANGVVLERTAGAQLSALVAVYERDGTVYPLDYRDSEHIDLLLGITVAASQIGAQLPVKRSGSITDSGWNWLPGRATWALKARSHKRHPHTVSACSWATLYPQRASSSTFKIQSNWSNHHASWLPRPRCGPHKASVRNHYLCGCRRRRQNPWPRP